MIPSQLVLFRLPQPSNFGRNVYNEYLKKAGKIPNYVTSAVQTSERTYSRTLLGGDIFSKADNTYDAYDKDIALLHFYFKKSTVFQLGTQPTMTWIDFLAQVGGLLGLCIGITFVSFIELFWLCLRILFQKLKLTHIIP